MNAYKTKGEPAYQVDFWNPPANTTALTDGCEVYAASFNDGTGFGFRFCSSSYLDKPGQIIAGR